MFNYLTPITYWILIIIWVAILWFCLKRLRTRKIEGPLFVTFLFILSIEAFRTLFESLYFGVWYTSVAGLLPHPVYEFLVQPELVFIPKAVNLLAAAWIATLLLRKWVPQEEEERDKAERQILDLEARNKRMEATQQALRESEERFRNIVEASPMGMHLYEHRPDGRLILEGANPAADAILGIRHEDLIGMEIAEAFPSLEFSEVPDRYKEICDTGKPWQTEDLYYKDGMITGAFQVYAFRTLPGRMATQFIDITERKQAEDILNKTQFAVDNAAIGILWLTLDGQFIFANKAAADMAGYTQEELLTMSVADLTAQVDMREPILERIKSEGPTTFEIQVTRKDGTSFPVEITSHYAKFGDQEFEFAFVLDRSKRKQAENALAELNRDLERLVEERTRALEVNTAQLQEANARLTEVDRLKSALLSSVTHELKTPLTSIIGFAKLTSRDFNRDFNPLTSGNISLSRKGNRISKNLSVIGEEATRLLGLIDNFLALSRIKAELDSVRQQPVQLARVIRHAASLSNSFFAANPNISLDVQISDSLPKVSGDPENLNQALLNLLDNAAKFTDAGMVHLTAGLSDTGYVHIAIRDEGAGIPVEERDKVFTPFHQVCSDSQCMVKPPGAGMGLAISKHIVESMGGSLRLECPKEGGCIFTIELPVEAKPENE